MIRYKDYITSPPLLFHNSIALTLQLRGGKIRYKEYINCGKGRDMGFDSINGEGALSGV